jgi:hypothetical protein
MSVKQFLNGSGQIYFADRFISVRLIREALEKHFKLRIIHESPNKAQYKIIRYVRIYGAPILFPHPTLNLNIDTEYDRVDYDFFWSDYYILVFAAFIWGLFSIGEGVSYPLLMAFGFCFYGILIFLDTKYVAYHVRRTLKQFLQAQGKRD